MSNGNTRSSGIVVKEALARASASRKRSPAVYMMLPRENARRTWDVADMPAIRRRVMAACTQAHRACRVDPIAQALMTAENPIARRPICRKPQAVAAGPTGAELRSGSPEFNRSTNSPGLALLRRLRSPAPVGTADLGSCWIRMCLFRKYAKRAGAINGSRSTSIL